MPWPSEFGKLRIGSPNGTNIDFKMSVARGNETPQQSSGALSPLGPIEDEYMRIVTAHSGMGRSTGSECYAMAIFNGCAPREIPGSQLSEDTCRKR